MGGYDEADAKIIRAGEIAKELDAIYARLVANKKIENNPQSERIRSNISIIAGALSQYWEGQPLPYNFLDRYITPIRENYDSLYMIGGATPPMDEAEVGAMMADRKVLFLLLDETQRHYIAYKNFEKTPEIGLYTKQLRSTAKA